MIKMTEITTMLGKLWNDIDKENKQIFESKRRYNKHK